MGIRERKLNDWRQTYQEKLITLEQAAELISSGDHIVIPNGYLGELPYALAARASELRNVTVEICAPVGDPGWLQPGMEESFNMVAINNITQIDLIGQITCESQFGPRLINGPGGQIEFHIGAFSAPNGRALSLMPSTWNDGLMSTIVPQLDEGSIVTIHRSFADYVITEWGGS